MSKYFIRKLEILAQHLKKVHLNGIIKKSPTLKKPAQVDLMSSPHGQKCHVQPIILSLMLELLMSVRNLNAGFIWNILNDESG